MNSEFDLMQYLNNGIENIIRGALRAAFKSPKESLFITKFALSSKEAAIIRMNYESLGKHIPSFLICSITENCNLHCKGCYSMANNQLRCHEGWKNLEVSEWRRIFQEASDIGVSFILLAGGEPLICREVIEAASDFKKITFPIFTNGTLFDEAYLKLFDKNRNLLPIISIEGDQEYTDSRRGNGIYQRLQEVMQRMKKKGIFYGTSITVTKENFRNVTGDSFLTGLYHNGCKVVFYVEYVPAGNVLNNLVLSDQDRNELDKKLRWFRLQYTDMLIISFPGDEKSSGGCLAAGRGFFHINSDGSAEPCPFSPYSDTNIKDCTLLEAIESPLFKKLVSNEILLKNHSGGCVLFDQQEEVRKICNEGK